MNRLTAAFALTILGAAGVALAQTQTETQSAPPAGTMPSSQYPSSSAPAPSSSTSSDSHAARKEQMKDCMAQQKANNSGMSKSDMKKYCKNEVESSSTSSSSQSGQSNQ